MTSYARSQVDQLDHSKPRDQSDGTAAVPWGPRIVEGGIAKHLDLCYAAELGYRPQFLDLWTPADLPGPYPVVVWLHGGTWSRGSYKRCSPLLYPFHQFEQLLDAGFAVAMVDYRMAWEVDCAGMCADVRAAVRWLRHYAPDFNLDIEHVGLWGESAGGHLALLSAFDKDADGGLVVGDFPGERTDIWAVVDWYGVADLRPPYDEFGPGMAGNPLYPENPVPRLRGDRSLVDITPICQVKAGVPPVFIVQGDADDAVPVATARELHAALVGVGADVEYLELPGAGHVFRGWRDVNMIIAASIEFLRERLR